MKTPGAVVPCVAYITLAFLSVSGADPLSHTSSRSRSVQTRMAGADDAEPHDLPSIVSIQIVHGRYASHVCGGTLVKENKILTSASCFQTPGDYQAVLGGHSLSSQDWDPYTQIIPIKRHEDHNKYTGNVDTRLQYDISIATLSKNAVLIPGVVELQKLSKGNPTRLENTPAFVFGWGSSSPGGKINAVMQYGRFRILPKDKCLNLEKDHPFNPKTQVCAKSQEVGTCDADTGSPMVDADGKQVGIVSLSTSECLVNYPSYFTSVGHYYHWIKRRL